MEGVVLTAANWPIIGQIADLLGIVMNFIYEILDKILPSDVGLVGLSIILYTILVYMIMMPLTIKQQRTSKMTAVMNPELQAIQKKYKNKRDQASQMKMQEEMQRCLPDGKLCSGYQERSGGCAEIPHYPGSVPLTDAAVL